MSRTRHHSRKWGPDHRWADLPDRARYSGNRDAGEAPGWHVRLYDERPGRRADKLTIGRLIVGNEDPEEATFIRQGNRKPHTWYW
ncbi:hypothetical protein [Roseomonas chloroacetimidivorans]|uniref:hypothetical protein n=1 Tax=Roseomonas chloroacetimidivorans TaxID=1766656 RepID=UPI003C738CD9